MNEQAKMTGVRSVNMSELYAAVITLLEQDDRLTELAEKSREPVNYLTAIALIEEAGSISDGILSQIKVIREIVEGTGATRTEE